VELLLEALLSTGPQARQAWEAWRAGVDMDTLPYSSQQLFPALSPAFPDWLEQDSSAAIINGIIRQAWSQNQLRLRRAVELEALWSGAGIRPLVAGPLAWALRTPGPAFRPIPYLTFLVPREQVRRAWGALLDTGWEATCDLPADPWWDWRGYVTARQGNLHVKLHWRLLAVPPEDAGDCEKAFLSRTEGVEWNQHRFWTTSIEATFLHILCGEREGDLPWQADVLLVGTARIDWPSFLELAQRFAPLGIARLRELRPFSRLALPELALDEPGALRKKLRHFWRLYRAHSYHRKKALN
jgi:Uncharacterised nucleotidyltransferase